MCAHVPRARIARGVADAARRLWDTPRAMDMRVAPGTLLAAWPDMLDPNFMHSVVLLCNHQREGAFGLVVNRDAGLTTRQLVPGHPVLGKVQFPVHLGGPVDHGTLNLVHSLNEEIPGGIEVAPGLLLGGDLDAFGALVEARPAVAAAHVRLFLGYAGWAAGQLEAELAMGSWLPAPLALESVFATELDAVWRGVIRSIGGEAKGLEHLPPDASWN